MKIDMLETPCIIIDEEKMMNNIKKQAEKISKNGVSFRPHAKSHKVPEFARRQINAGAVGVTCAKVSEAEVMANSGINDIFIAYSLIGEGKINRAINLSRKIRLITAVDSIDGAKMLSTVLGKNGQSLEVRLEVDLGAKRTGVKREEAVDAAKFISSLPGIHLTGLYGYKSLNHKGEFSWDTKLAGHEEGEILTAVADEMRKAGIGIKDVSVGSTPTGEFAAEVKGVTEIRAGTYIFGDVKMVMSKYCTFDDCAAKLLMTVVSRPYKDLLVLDGGNKTISTDLAPGSPLGFKSFGLINNDPTLILDRMNEEHGIVRITGNSDLKVGDRVTVIPNHICTTVNLHNFVHLIRKDELIATYAVEGRGMLQ